MRMAIGVEYDGRRYCGWQSQPDVPNVQDTLRRALARIAGGPVSVAAAGRTDTGVHALEQVVHFDACAERPLTAWVRGTNALLPESIAVRWAHPVPDEFHARFSAQGRSYRYLLLDRPVRSAIHAGRVGWFHVPLDLAAMQEAARHLLGEHDFSAFRASECQARSPVKHLRQLDIRREGEMLVFDLSADAFLHHMVRNIVGCLVYVGNRKHPPGWLKEILESRNRALAAPVQRQSPNVFRMKLLGATVVPVESGSTPLKDALKEAMRDWVTNIENTFYIIGTVAGPHPYPMLVRDFNAVVSREAVVQMPELAGRQPDAVIACVGGGSNAMGVFYHYIDMPGVKLIGVEAGGHGIASGQHAAPLTANSPIGVLHGNKTCLMQDADGQIIETHSISAGLDYPGVGPEHAWLKDSGRAEYVAIDDDEALAAFDSLCRYEGIIPALESSHALAHAIKIAPSMGRDKVLLVNLSGRGDKDINTVARLKGITL